MLEDLHIHDFALIGSSSLDFSTGFTVLTGETGAGKSILIGALSFLLGGKTGTEVIRAGADEALVSGTFLLGHSAAPEAENAYAWLSARGIEAENDRVLLRRTIRGNGKSGAWIGNTPVTRAELAEFSSFLIDIHGQHDHQSLLRVPEHRRFLDAFAGITREVETFTASYAKLIEKRNELALITSAAAQRGEKIEMLTFAVNEIAEARLSAGEDDALSDEEARLSQFEKLYGAVDDALRILSDSDTNLVSQSKRVYALLGNAAPYDKALEPVYKRTESAFYELSDIAEELRSYNSKLVFDPARFEEVQERLALIFKLKKKYATVQSPIADVIAYGENARRDLETLSHGEEKRDELVKIITAMERDLYAKAKWLSSKRHAAAHDMAQRVEGILEKLGMAGTKFTVQILEKDSVEFTQRCGPQGIDNIEFLISANRGSPERPLAKIASGGEISRVMLALKTVLAASDTIGTLVFDEIDTGIGGEVSVAVGNHLKNLAANRQILCITHLASIAVYADTHIRIEKHAENTRTVTNAQIIAGNDRITEIARMLSGTVSAQSLEHAKALLNKFSGKTF